MQCVERCMEAVSSCRGEGPVDSLTLNKDSE